METHSNTSSTSSSILPVRLRRPTMTSRQVIIKKLSWHLICSRSCNTLKLKVQSSRFINPEWCCITCVFLLKYQTGVLLLLDPGGGFEGRERNKYVSSSVCEGPSLWSPTCGVLVWQLPRPKQKPAHDGSPQPTHSFPAGGINHRAQILRDRPLPHGSR